MGKVTMLGRHLWYPEIYFSVEVTKPPSKDQNPDIINPPLGWTRLSLAAFRSPTMQPFLT